MPVDYYICESALKEVEAHLNFQDEILLRRILTDNPLHGAPLEERAPSLRVFDYESISRGEKLKIWFLSLPDESSDGPDQVIVLAVLRPEQHQKESRWEKDISRLLYLVRAIVELIRLVTG